MPTEIADGRTLAEAFMRDRFNAQLMWEMRGPKGTMVEWLQCWRVPKTLRLVIIECFDRGWECFPQTMSNGLAETEAYIRRTD